MGRTTCQSPPLPTTWFSTYMMRIIDPQLRLALGATGAWGQAHSPWIFKSCIALHSSYPSPPPCKTGFIYRHQVTSHHPEHRSAASWSSCLQVQEENAVCTLTRCWWALSSWPTKARGPWRLHLGCTVAGKVSPAETTKCGRHLLCSGNDSGRRVNEWVRSPKITKVYETRILMENY